MNCKFCGSPRTMKYGFKAGTQYYKCNDCKRKFAGRDNPEGMRFSTSNPENVLNDKGGHNDTKKEAWANKQGRKETVRSTVPYEQ